MHGLIKTALAPLAASKSNWTLVADTIFLQHVQATAWTQRSWEVSILVFARMLINEQHPKQCYLQASAAGRAALAFNKNTFVAKCVKKHGRATFDLCWNINIYLDDDDTTTSQVKSCHVMPGDVMFRSNSNLIHSKMEKNASRTESEQDRWRKDGARKPLDYNNTNSLKKTHRITELLKWSEKCAGHLQGPLEIWTVSRFWLNEYVFYNFRFSAGRKRVSQPTSTSIFYGFIVLCQIKQDLQLASWKNHVVLCSFLFGVAVRQRCL